MLLLLKQWSGHGYWLLQSLRRLGLGDIDHTALYKELRNLEKRGLLASSWLTDTAGPARRVYALTEAGEQVLQAWAGTVTQYQKMWATFFDLYSTMLNGLAPGSPPAPPQSPRDGNTGPRNKASRRRSNHG